MAVTSVAKATAPGTLHAEIVTAELESAPTRWGDVASVQFLAKPGTHRIGDAVQVIVGEP